MTKPLREILKGQTFRIVGSPHWLVASNDALFDKQRGVCVVTCKVGEVRALGHMMCEVHLDAKVQP